MSKRKKRNVLPVVIVLLAVVLIAVVGLILWKQWEYSASADFYSGLRGALECGGIGI